MAVRSGVASATVALAAMLSAGLAFAQTTAAPASPPAGQAAPADPVLARVDGREIHLSDLTEAAQSLPAEYRSMPAPVLMPMLLDQAIDRAALLAVARRQKLEEDPAVQRQLGRARDQVLENAVLGHEVGPKVNEAAVRARYDQEIAGKPGEEEVHARHILVGSEQEARDIIAQLGKGADFAALAKAHSTDPAAAQGGDLGFFKKGDMLPEFSAAAFALQPGQVSQTPVKTQYGWHVIKLEERRTAPPEPYEKAHDALRERMVQDGVQTALADARASVKVERLNPDGTPQRPTDTAEPPPAPKK